jgi:hypothetical protein
MVSQITDSVHGRAPFLPARRRSAVGACRICESAVTQAAGDDLVNEVKEQNWPVDGHQR